MSAYYEAQQWPPAGQAGWEHQTPPPARSGMSRVFQHPPIPLGCAAWLLRTELTIKYCHRSELGHPTRGIRRLLPPARGYVYSTRGLPPTQDGLAVPGQVRTAEPGNRLLTG